jgi:hypothetical protein
MTSMSATEKSYDHGNQKAQWAQMLADVHHLFDLQDFMSGESSHIELRTLSRDLDETYHRLIRETNSLIRWMAPHTDASLIKRISELLDGSQQGRSVKQKMLDRIQADGGVKNIVSNINAALVTDSGHNVKFLARLDTGERPVIFKFSVVGCGLAILLLVAGIAGCLPCGAGGAVLGATQCF